MWQEAENNSSKGSKARFGEPSSTKVWKIKKLRWGNSNEKNAGTIVRRESYAGKNSISRYGHGCEPCVITDI